MIDDSSLIIKNCELHGYARTLMHMYEKLVGHVLESGNENLVHEIIEINKQLETLSHGSEQYKFWRGFKYKNLELR